MHVMKYVNIMDTALFLRVVYPSDLPKPPLRSSFLFPHLSDGRFEFQFICVSS